MGIRRDKTEPETVLSGYMSRKPRRLIPLSRKQPYRLANAVPISPIKGESIRRPLET
jgi:hypothetical protein